MENGRFDCKRCGNEIIPLQISYEKCKTCQLYSDADATDCIEFHASIKYLPPALAHVTFPFPTDILTQTLQEGFEALQVDISAAQHYADAFAGQIGFFKFYCRSGCGAGRLYQNLHSF